MPSTRELRANYNVRIDAAAVRRRIMPGERVARMHRVLCCAVLSWGRMPTSSGRPIWSCARPARSWRSLRRDVESAREGRLRLAVQVRFPQAPIR